MLRTNLKFISAAGIACLWSASAAAQVSCGDQNTTYKVGRVDADTFSVEADFATPTSRLDVYFFPIKGRSEGQVESIKDLQAYDGNNAPISLKYVGEGGWETDSAQKAARITYQVRADHDAVDWGDGGPGKDEVATRFDNSYFFVGHAFFVIDYDWPSCPIDVVFDLPDDWVVTSPWPMNEMTATPSTPSNLARNGFAMGTDRPKSAKLGELEITWLTSANLKPVEKRITELMEIVPAEYSEFFGGAPGQKFNTYFFSDYMTDGGAFENSFAMRVAYPLSAADELVWSHTLGHETMHLWNGAGGIKGANPERTYWFTEGFTDYLTIKLMRKAGLIDDALLQQRLANILRRFEIAKRRSPNVKLADAGAKKMENWELIYGGGALTALLLDAELSAKDPTAFRRAMRDLYAHSDEPYELERLMARLNASTGGKAGELVSWIEGAPSAMEIRKRLASSGIDVTNFGFDEVYVVFPDCGKPSCAPAFLAGP